MIPICNGEHTIGGKRLPEPDVAQRLQPFFNVLNVLENNHTSIVPHRGFEMQIFDYGAIPKMQTDLNHGVTTLFRDATKQNLMQSLKTPEDWESFNKIQDTAREAEQSEKADFDRDKSDLFVKAREDVINKAGSNTFEHPTPYGTDKFAKSTTEAQARQKVEHGHQNRLTKIREDEGLAYAGLKQGIRAREQSRGMPTEDFNRVNDRRSEPDRRIGPDRRMPGPER